MDDTVAWGTAGSPGFTFTAGSWYNLKMAVAGNNQYGRAWQLGATEPSSWQVSQAWTDRLGLTAGLSGGNNSTMSYKDFRVRRYAATEPTTSVGAEGTVNPSATFGGVAATSMTYSNSTSIGGVTPAHALGPVTIAVMNPDGSVGSLLNGFTYGAASGLFLIFE